LFFDAPVYAWWLSVGAIFLNASWTLHNVISWMKIKPFLSRPGSIAFIGSVILVQPYWVVEIYANFAYFHGINDIFKKTRPWYEGPIKNDELALTCS
jgi:DNA modification methylase